MPTFHFEAMGSAGETEAGHIHAASADEAMKMLRTRGLFVTTLKNELTEASDDGKSFESLDGSSSASPTSLWALAAGGLASFLFGVGLFGWEMHFLAGAKKVTAFKVRDAVHGTVLQIRDGKRVVDFPAHSEDNHPLGSVNVLYNPEVNAARYQNESHARLLGGPFFAALGSLFLLVALVGLRNLRGGAPAADWTNLALLLTGVAALGAVGCWVVASFETGWRWGFSTCLLTLLMTGLAIAAFAAVKHGFRSLLQTRGERLLKDDCRSVDNMA